MKTPSAERALFLAVIAQAVDDILLCPNVLIDPFVCYRKDSNRYNASSAYRFFNKKNKQFQNICWLLSLDPDYTVEQVYKYINQKIQSKHIKKGSVDAMPRLSVSL